MRKLCLSALLTILTAAAQEVRIYEAAHIEMPGTVDSNSPAFWLNGQLHLFNSTGGGMPVLSRGPDQFELSSFRTSKLTTADGWPAWIESVWLDPAGPIFAFYHQEDFSVCPGRLSQPRIGVAVSMDKGASFRDLGLVLTSSNAPDCSSRNGYFTGGHGDVSVIEDRAGEYFYFFFGNYGGPLETQGVVAARLSTAHRYNPIGNVWKYHDGEWTEPGLGGRTTPLFPAAVDWQREDTDSFWGPSIHWNTYLNTFVILMNRSCCSSGWPQESIYITFNSDLSNPSGWSEPKAILGGYGWYPQVLGMREGETDSIAGQRARLWVYGKSDWEIEFILPDGIASETPEVAPPDEGALLNPISRVHPEEWGEFEASDQDTPAVP